LIASVSITAVRFFFIVSSLPPFFFCLFSSLLSFRLFRLLVFPASRFHIWSRLSSSSGSVSRFLRDPATSLALVFRIARIPVPSLSRVLMSPLNPFSSLNVRILPVHAEAILAYLDADAPTSWAATTVPHWMVVADEFLRLIDGPEELRAACQFIGTSLRFQLGNSTTR
jgi:hypothetical protein